MNATEIAKIMNHDYRTVTIGNYRVTFCPDNRAYTEIWIAESDKHKGYWRLCPPSVSKKAIKLALKKSQH